MQVPLAVLDRGHYDLVGPDNETISLHYYEDVVYPGMKLRMVLWSEIPGMRSNQASSHVDEDSDEEYHQVEDCDSSAHSDDESRKEYRRPRPARQDRSRSSSLRPRSPARNRDYRREEENYELVEREDCSCDECKGPRRAQHQRKTARNVGRAGDRR